MIKEQITDREAPSRSLTEYATDLARSGVRIFPGEPGTFWIRYESSTMMRIPIFHVGSPAPNEVREVLWRGRAAIASYLLEPDVHHPANAWLYLCTDHTYALEKLSKGMRQDVRRGLKELRIAPLTADEVLAHGAQAFCDTRRRAGLSDGTPEEFRQRFTAAASLSEGVFLGAWKDNQLAAFLPITEVANWAEIEGNYSMDALLQYRPNQVLFYSAFLHYLVERRCCLVSGGMSTIQAESKASGLHIFKQKVGYKAYPVHRAFVLHPLLRPFANRLTLWGVNTMLRFRPGDRRLKKAGGVLASMLGDTRMLEGAERSTSDE